MGNTYFEFQSKGSNAPVFDLKIPDFDSPCFMTPNKKIVYFKDGERLIAKVIEEQRDTLMNVTYMTVEDIHGNTATISSKNFHKITDPKQWSKKFKNFKLQNHIVDAL
jgi:phage regulator Rha-like protein